MRSPPLLWTARIAWLLLPVGIGELLAAVVTDRSYPVAIAVVVTSWAVWAAGVTVLAAPGVATLTAARVLAPIPLIAGAVGAVLTTPDALGWFGIVVAAIACAAVMSAEVGGAFVDAASYGDERRFTLRTPALVAAVAVPVVWALTVVPPAVAILAIAARAYPLGAAAAMVAVPGLLVGPRVLHRLATRWMVFVPAGITVVDRLALSEPVLFAARQLTRIGPAHVDSTAVDLTAGAAGLIVELATSTPTEVTPVVRRGATAAAVPASSVLVCPSRPGAALAEAERRGLPVRRD